MINIRKFPSVKVFMSRVSQLDSVLQSIELFSTEVRQLQLKTPGGPEPDSNSAN